MRKEASARLPRTVRPEKYVLSLRPNLKEFTFEGDEDVEIIIEEEVSQIVLNAAELEITSAELMSRDGVVIPAKAIEIDESSERTTLSFERPLSKGPATLTLRFHGALNDQLRGFYRSMYETPEGEERYMAATQFEATDARRAFPCWDEPSIKAVFGITLVIPEGLVAVSNTPIVAEEAHGEGMKVVRFAETPRMSTYLLAFVVGEMASVEAKAGDGTLTSVWATPDKAEYGRFAVETSARILDYMNDYFGIPYPLEKLDHIALPDFAAGAMENWGAITYRERVLLFDPASSTSATKQAIAEVMAHEIAHMWFGDLVTMEWWDNLWLNESFASWMGNKAVGELFPEWNMWTQFLLQEAMGGLNLDGLRTSHPVEVPVGHPDEIEEIFDAISYNKGASILWMLEQYLGEDVFRQGMNLYFTTHKYGNARTEDLWRAFGEVSDQDVVGLMRNWVQQTGFPLLTSGVEREDGDASLHLSQSRFLYERLHGATKDETLWRVPLQVLRAGEAQASTSLMTDRKVRQPLGRGRGAEANDWVKVNAGQSGFYRVNYPEEEWQRLARAVETLELPERDRLGLQSDAYALMRAGFIPATLYLSITEAYVNEADPNVWRILSSNLQSFEIAIMDTSFLEHYFDFGRSLFRPVAKRIGWDAARGEGHLDALKRRAVLGRLGMFEENDTLDEARKRFEGYVGDPVSLNPDLKDIVFVLSGRESDRSIYDKLWELENAATLNEEKARFLRALASPKSESLLRETLERAITEEVRSQDAVLVISDVGDNRYGRDLAWEFTKDHWDELYRRYGKTGHLIRRLISVTESFTTLDRAREVEEFFKAHPVPAAKMKVQQALERIRLNAKWLEVNGQGLEEWLARRD